MLEPDLEAGDVLFDLLDEGQMLSQLRQASVWLDAHLLDRCRAGSDENRVKLVVFGTAQMQPSISFYLDWLQDQDGEAFVPQITDDTLFIAAAGLDADTHHLGASEVGSQTPPTRRRIVHLPAIETTVSRDIEFSL